MTLQSFSKGRLPLNTPVIYYGLSGKIVGRTFGAVERYDLLFTDNSKAFNVELSQISISFKELKHA